MLRRALTPGAGVPSGKTAHAWSQSGRVGLRLAVRPIQNTDQRSLGEPHHVNAMSELRPPGSSPSVPRSERVVEEHLFRFLIELEINKARRLHYCVSVVCLAPDSSPGEAHQFSPRRFGDVVLNRIRATDVASVFGNSFGLLLVDADRASLPSIVARVKGEMGAVARAAGEEGSRRTWSGGGASYPQTAASGAHLVRQALDLLVRAKGEGGDRFYLPS